MKKSQKKQLLNILFVLALAAFTVWTVSDMDFAAVQDFFAVCNPWFLIGALVCMVGYFFFEGISLHLIIRRFGGKPRFRDSIAYASADVYYSAITPSATGGQPASAFYMMRDGIPGGIACFGLIFNLLAFAAAFLVVGAVVLIANFSLFLSYGVASKILILIGLGFQAVLILVFGACLFFPNMILGVGHFFINLLCKIRIFRNKEKWMGKIDGMVENYRSSLDYFKHHKMLIFPVLFFDILQRMSLIGISCFVCASITDLSMWEIFSIQTFVVLGFNAVPLPGGSGAFEYMYLEAYAHVFTDDMTKTTMLITRVISYYLSMVVCAAITLIHHLNPPKQALSESEKQPTEALEESADTQENKQ